MKKITRIGVGGPVGSGKTAVIEAVVPLLMRRGVRPLIITNDVVTTEDAQHVRRALAGVLEVLFRVLNVRAVASAQKG